MCTQRQYSAGPEATLPVIDQMGINCQQGGDPAGAEAHLQERNDPPAGLLLGRVFAIGPKPDQQVFRAQGLFQPLRMRPRLDGQMELVLRRPREGRDLRGPVVMEPQGLRGELM
jgi:hypothetical protein